MGMTTGDDDKKGNYAGEDKKIKVLLEKFRISAEIQNSYNSLFWSRTTVFFAINTALFAGYGLVATKILELNLLAPHAIPITLMLVIFGAVGALLSYYWLHIHNRATFLQDYYRDRAGVIEEKITSEPELSDLPEIFGETYSKATTKEKVPSSLRESLKWIHVVFICVWILLSLMGAVILLVVPRS